MNNLKEIQKSIDEVNKYFKDEIEQYKNGLDLMEHKMNYYDVDSHQYQSARCQAYGNRATIDKLNIEWSNCVNKLKADAYELLIKGD